MNKTGVLLVNLGTPTAPEAAAIRRWLRQFLSDPRVIELPRIIWLPLLYGLILPLRPIKLVPRYRSVWTPRGSPLLANSRDQQGALQAALGADMPVALAMRYGVPDIESGISELERAGVTRIVVLPLYPQYSATTTASVFDAVFAALSMRRLMPEALTIRDYHDHPAYIAALAASVRAHWDVHGRGEHLLLSFHGLPQACVDQGDPYARQCETTAHLLAQALQLRDGEWTLAYQSRVGRAVWLAPYTDVLIAQLPARGVRQLDVICPGFAADCLETLEEVTQRYGELFTHSGGAALRYVTALNAQPSHIEMLRTLCRARSC